jgi:hypothetical protein
MFHSCTMPYVPAVARILPLGLKATWLPPPRGDKTARAGWARTSSLLARASGVGAMRQAAAASCDAVTGSEASSASLWAASWPETAARASCWAWLSHYPDIGIARQPVRAQGTRGPAVAAGPSPRPAPLHAHVFLLDQPGRTVVRRAAAALPGPGRVLLPRRAHHRAGRVDQDLECQRPALQVDQDSRPDHRPHLPLLLTHLRTGTLAVVRLSGLGS